jgi:NAD(P)-dependent dehydrogenase (short-subunit alcohol dehydrogenase family)
MFIKTLAIELGRTHPEAICVALHPGTVDTDLSRPFQKNVAAERLFSPKKSALHLLTVIHQLTAQESGRTFAWDGIEICP